MSLIYTKIVYPQARLIRLPFDIRNRRFIEIGNNFVTGPGCRIEAFPVKNDNKKCIKIGNNVLIGPGAFVNFNVPDNSIVLGNPGKILFNKKNATRGYIKRVIS